MHKLYYIVPHYGSGEATHFSYAVDLARRLNGFFEIYILIEGGSYVGDGGVAQARVMRFRFLPLRVIELVIRIASARRAGFKDFYVHYSFAAALAAILVTRFSGGRVFYWNCGEPWKFRRGKLREFLERLVYGNISYLVTGTSGLKRGYATTYDIPESKIRVVPNWIALPPPQSDAGLILKMRESLGLKDRRAALFVHRLSARKGANFIPRIAQSLKEKNIVLIVVGDGPLMTTLKREVNSLRLEEWVVFTGNVPQKEIGIFYETASLFVLPSREEGFPHVLLEAMAYGVPYVAFDVGAVREITPPELHRYVVPCGEIGLLCDRLKELSGASDLGRLGGLEKEWVKNFSAEKAARIFTEMVNAL